MGRYAIVEDSTGNIWNVMEWDGDTPYEVLDGWHLVDVTDNEDIARGGTIVKDQYTPPVIDIPAPEPTLEDRMAALETNVSVISENVALIADATSVTLPPPIEITPIEETP